MVSKDMHQVYVGSYAANIGELTADPTFGESEKGALAIGNQRLDHIVSGHQTVVITSDAIPQPFFAKSDPRSTAYVKECVSSDEKHLSEV